MKSPKREASWLTVGNDKYMWQMQTFVTTEQNKQVSLLALSWRPRQTEGIWDLSQEKQITSVSLLKSMTRGVWRLAQLLTEGQRTGRFSLLQSYNVVRLRRVQWNGSEMCWSSAACAGIHTCRRWHRRLRCGRCSCARAAQWPVRSHPSPRWSGGRRRQSGAHSTLLAERQQSVSVVLSICQFSTGGVFEDIRQVNQLTSK